MRLNDLLPDYYDQNVTMQTLQTILSRVSDDLDTGLSTTISECFAATASKYLSRYEQMYGLEVSASMSDQYRKERIVAKLAGVGTTTKQMIEETAKNYSNGEVEVIEDTENYRFTIRFVGTLGIPGNMEGLKLTIEEIKPAHLAVTYEYLFNTWHDVSPIRWGQIKVLTWKEMREERL